MKRSSLVVVLLGLGLTVAGDVTQDVMKCGSIESNLDRLRCYDRIARPADGGEEGALVQDLERDEPVVRAEDDAFGDEQLRHDEDDRVEQITATIVRVEKLSRGTYQLTFDDGQVWREIEYDIKSSYSVGDEVVISRGFLGSYNLASRATGQSNKVRRIK